MSQLPPQAIDEFQALWKKHYGHELPRDAATARAHQVFALVRLLVEKPAAPESPDKFAGGAFTTVSESSSSSGTETSTGTNT